MKLSELPEILNLNVVQDQYQDTDVTEAYTSDLLSDVMAHGHDAEILITIQSHKNTVAVATLTGASAIIICNDRPVPTDMIDAARQEEIAIFISSENQFTISGRLYGLLNRE